MKRKKDLAEQEKEKKKQAAEAKKLQQAAELAGKKTQQFAVKVVARAGASLIQLETLLKDKMAEKTQESARADVADTKSKVKSWRKGAQQVLNISPASGKTIPELSMSSKQLDELCKNAASAASSFQSMLKAAHQLYGK